MLLPALSKAREKARQTVCMNNLKQLNIALLMYSNDNDDYLLPSWNGGRCWWNVLVENGYLEKYLDYSLGNSQKKLKKPNILTCPSSKRWYDGWSHSVNYQMNSRMCGFMYKGWFFYGKLQNQARLNMIKYPSQSVWVTDAAPTDWNPVGERCAYEFNPYWDGSSRVLLVMPDDFFHPGYYGYVSGRHGGGGNVLFIDGSVRWFRAGTYRSPEVYLTFDGAEDW